MLDLVYDPDGFFGRRRDAGGLLPPILVVSATGLSGVGGPVVLLIAIVDSVTGVSGRFFALGFAIGIVGALVGPFLEWAVLSTAFYVLSRRFDGHGALSDVVRLAGWGYLPAIPAGFVSAAAMVLALQGHPVPDDPAHVLGFIDDLRSTPPLRTAALLSPVFALWSGLLWTFAVKHARHLGIRRAAACVAPPVALSIAWRLYHLL